MTKILKAAAELEKGKTNSNKNNVYACKQTSINDTKPKLRVGWSECRIRIDMENDKINCSVSTNSNHTMTYVPFRGTNDTSAAAVWVCGDRAYVLPKKWSGYCYPALMNVGTSVYLPE